MSQADLFSLEWNLLQERRREITARIDGLNVRLNSLGQTFEHRELQAAKHNLRHSIRNLVGRKREYEKNISERWAVIRDGQKVLSGTEPAEKFYLSQKKFVKNLERAIKKGRHIKPIAMEFAKDVRDCVAMPIPQIIFHFDWRNTHDELTAQYIQQEIDLAQTHIDLIDENLRKTRSLLEKEIQAMQDEKAACWNQEIIWATQDQQRLAWLIVGHSSYKHDALRYYQERWPGEDVSEFTGKQIFDPVPFLDKRPRIYRQGCTTEPTENAQHHEADIRCWEFFLVSGKDDDGVPMPCIREEFIRQIQPYLRNNVRGLNIGALYDRLMGTTKMSLHQRQTYITKILDPNFRGWQRLKIAGYRIPILIDENARKIKFIPCKKGDELYPKD